jgi:hypothetical protein
MAFPSPPKYQRVDALLLELLLNINTQFHQRKRRNKNTVALRTNERIKFDDYRIINIPISFLKAPYAPPLTTIPVKFVPSYLPILWIPALKLSGGPR